MAHSNLTKRALASAMKELMSQRPFSKINVGDICEVCGLNRKSFYYHFQDKYDLVNWIFETEFISVVQASPMQDRWELIERLCSYFFQNRTFYRAALEVRGQNSFPEYFREVLRPIMRATLSDILENVQEDTGDFVADFYADAFLCAIDRWMAERDPISAEAFSERLRLCVDLGAARGRVSGQ